jgi:diadenosine tetraphosphate (Ap4A) HIT family hydrolase
MDAANNCLFCRIAAGHADASILYQDEFVSAFMDLFPIVAGHLLVIPNAHAARLGELDEGLSTRVFSLGRRLGEALQQSALPAQAIGYYLADGPKAGQVVPHVHLHVIPRFAGDGAAFPLRLKAPIRAVRTKLDAQASEIQAALHGQAIPGGELKRA